MLIAVLVLLSCVQIAATLLCFALAARALRNLTRDAMEAANAELSKLVAGEECQSASVLNAVGRMVGGEAGRSAKAALMADLSHAQRAANADAEQQAVDAVGEQHPGIGAVLAGMGPRARRGAMKNPLLQLGIQAVLGGGIGGLFGGGNHNNNGGGSSPPAEHKFPL